MKVIDPGHLFRLDVFSGLRHMKKIANNEALIFMKREGPGYPGNTSHYKGTNLQECWRAEISRLRYLQNQEPCLENIYAIRFLQYCIHHLEVRAAKRHNRTPPGFDLVDGSVNIEDISTCDFCGHILCNGECQK